MQYHLEDAKALVEQYYALNNRDSLFYRINHFGREPSTEKKAEQILEQKTVKYKGIRGFINRHPKIIGALIGVQGLVSVMSPTHPFAVDSYLVSRAYEIITQQKSDVSREELEDFLTTKEQVEIYRSDFIKDVQDRTSEKAFVIVRDKQGRLKQKPVR